MQTKPFYIDNLGYYLKKAHETTFWNNRWQYIIFLG